MSGKSLAPAQAGGPSTDVDSTKTTPEREEPTQGNAAAQAKLDAAASEPEDDGGGWWGSLKSAVGLGGDEGDPSSVAAKLIESGASDTDKLAQLEEWLTDGWLDRVTGDETAAARMLLDTMSDQGKKDFLELDDGALAKQLMKNPDGDPWWADPLGAIAGNFTEAAKEIGETASDMGDAWDSYKSGDEALEVAQEAAGGSLGGMVLDKSGDHSLDVDGDLTSNTFTVDMPELKVESFEAKVGATKLTTGAGFATGLTVTIDVPDRQSAEASVAADIKTLDWGDINLESPATSVVIPHLVLAVLRIAALRSPIDPGEVSAGEYDGAISSIQNKLADAFMFMGLDLAPELARMGAAAKDAGALAEGLSNASTTSSMDYSLSFDTLSLPTGAKLTQHTTEGDTVTEIGALDVESFDLTLRQTDRLAMLREERDKLASSTDMIDKQRLSWLDGEIPRVETLAKRKAELDAKKRTGTLTADEQDDWVEFGRELKAGVLNVQSGVISLRDVTRDGQGVDDLTLEGVDAEVSTKAFAAAGRDVGETGDEKLSGLQAALDDQAGRTTAPEPGEKNDALWGDLGEMSAKAEVKKVSAGGIESSKGDADGAMAKGLSINASGKYLGVKADSGTVEGVDGSGVTVDNAGVTGVNLAVTGNDVGGRVGSVEGDGIAYADGDTKIDLKSGAAEDVRFDADAKGMGLRSGSAGNVEASGVGYSDGDRKITVDDLSGEGLSTSGASKSGADKVDADSFNLNGLGYEEDGTTLSVASASTKGFSAAGVTTSGADKIDADDLGLTTLDYDDGEQSVKLGSAGGKDFSATGVSTSGADKVAAGSVNAADAHYAGGGKSVDVTSASANGFSASGVTKSGAAEVAAKSAGASGVHYDDGARKVDVGSASTTGFSASGVSTSGVDKLDADVVDLASVDYGAGDTKAHVGDARFEGVSGTGLSTDGTGVVAADKLTAHDVSGGTTGASGSADLLTAEGLAATRTEDGTVATVDGAHVEGIKGSYGDIDADVKSADVGRSGVVLDGDNNVVGAAVDGLDVKGIHVDLLRLPMNETDAGDSGPAESFHADSLASASGAFSARIPLVSGGYVSVKANADDGMVSVNDLDIAIKDAGLLKGLAGKMAGMLQIDEGRGLTAGLGPFSFFVALDEADYDGLLSKRDGGGKKGSIALQPFVESMMNGKTELSVDEVALREELTGREGRRERRRARRLERRAERSADEEEVEYDSTQEMIDAMIAKFGSLGAGMALDANAANVNISGLTLGDGALGYDSMQATLDNGGNAQANQFTIRGTLGEEMSVGAHTLAASSLTAAGPNGPIDLATVGIRGLSVIIDQPLSSSRSIEVDVDGMTVRSIRYGDTSKLDAPADNT
ncbi:MAG: hypothetical protein KC912_13415 [Proteobacteria bacterium]|nr:hypothetical protein [Pseudomonadota bacterium]